MRKLLFVLFVIGCVALGISLPLYYGLKDSPMISKEQYREFSLGEKVSEPPHPKFLDAPGSPWEKEVSFCEPSDASKSPLEYATYTLAESGHATIILVMTHDAKRMVYRTMFASHQKELNVAVIRSSSEEAWRKFDMMKEDEQVGAYELLLRELGKEYEQCIS